MPAPSRLLRSVAAVALATSATGLAYVGSAAPARAAGYNGYCTSSSGVTVVVDFRSLGGGVAIRCAPVGSGATGAQALAAAGIPVTQPSRMPGFVCRLYGKPASDPCVNTPPTDAHWDYWKAANGGSWSYSSTGYSTSQVIAGGFEGWSFSSGTKAAPRATPRRPTPAPPPKPAPSRTTSTAAQPPAPPVRHTTKPAPRPATSSSSSRSSAAHTSSSSTAPKKSHASSTSSSAPASGSSSGSTAAAAGAARFVNSDNLIHQSDKSSGINATTVVGGIVLVVLAVGGGAVAILRRRSVE